MIRVIIESPFAAPTAEGVARNERYARACLADSLARGEAPFVSHLLYTQPGVLDDALPDERRKGMEAGWRWTEAADLVAVYTDLGVSKGMQDGHARGHDLGKPVVYRTIEGWS